MKDVVVGIIYGALWSKHGRSDAGVGDAGRQDGGVQETAGTRNDMGESEWRKKGVGKLGFVMGDGGCSCLRKVTTV